MNVHAYCICTTVSRKALQGLLEASGRGTLRDEHPWIVASELLDASRAAGQQLPVLFAAGTPAGFSHWGFIEELHVVELHRATWETTCAFSPLQAVNPIFEPIDSLFLKPSAEQARREQLEGIHQHRYALTESELHPYAICETPAFILKRD